MCQIAFTEVLVLDMLETFERPGDRRPGAIHLRLVAEDLLVSHFVEPLSLLGIKRLHSIRATKNVANAAEKASRWSWITRSKSPSYVPHELSMIHCVLFVRLPS